MYSTLMKGLVVLFAAVAPLTSTCKKMDNKAKENQGEAAAAIQESASEHAPIVVPEVVEGLDKNPWTPIRLSDAQRRTADSVNAFSLEFMRRIALAEKGNDLMVSPYSLSACLLLAASGAGGDTFDQMVSTLGFAGMEADSVGSFFKTFSDALLEADSGSTLSVANGIWVGKNVTIFPAYEEAVRKWYSAAVESVDFADRATVKMVNDWIESSTRGMIPGMFSEFSPDLKALLANAVYFKGSWMNGPYTPFEATFTDYKGVASKREFFGDTGFYDYCSGKDGAICRIPYGNGAFNMLVLLPPAGTDIDKYLETLTPEKWSAMLRGMRDCKVHFEMPSFKGETTVSGSLQKSLEQMGMVLPFTGAADFSKLSPESFFISQIMQRTAVDVNEKGTEAAAVTVILMETTSAEPVRTVDFIVNRPFIYAICERTTDIPLFIGIKRL